MHGSDDYEDGEIDDNEADDSDCLLDPELAAARAMALSPGPPRPPSLPGHTKLVFAKDRDRDATKAKMRLTLRAAARHGHDQLVLGALGCGVFGNPAEDVAHCWLEVLREDEFAGAGHWWRDVVFAVYAGSSNSNSSSSRSRDSSNYSIFRHVLDGQQV